MNRKIVAFMLILAIVLGVVNTPKLLQKQKQRQRLKA